MTLVQSLGRLSDRLTMRLLGYAEIASPSSSVQAEELSIIRRAQMGAVMSLSRAMMIANICNAAALVLLGWRQGSLTLSTWIWFALVVVFAGYGLLSAHRFLSSAPRRKSSRRAPGKILISSLMLAVIWTYPILYLMHGGTPLEIVFISAVTAGMIAGGALALYPVPLASLIYTGILSTAALPHIALETTEQTLPFILVIIGFTGVALSSVKRHAGLFLSDLLRILEAERHRDSINLLLESYQGSVDQCFWRSNDDFQLKTSLDSLTKMLGLEPNTDMPNTLTDLLLSCAAQPYDTQTADVLPLLLGPANGRPDHFELMIVVDQNAILKLVGQRAKSDGGPFDGYIGYLKNVTAETRAQENIYRLATRDAMTDLLNYAEFTKRATAKLLSDDWFGESMVAAFLFIDADNLKTVNDTLGHATGDCLLTTIAQRLRDLLPDDSLIARKGGDEFLALVKCKCFQDAELISQNTLSALNRTFRTEGNEASLSCSVGVSIHLGKKATLKQLELEADRALYHAKSLGKRQLTIYDSANGHKIGQDRVLSRDLADAVRRGDFHLEFQPIVHSVTMKIAGAEALLRWFHPELGLVDPEKVVQLAAKRGNGSGLLDFVLRNACEAAQSWPDHTFVSVNVVAGDLQRQNFAEQILDTLTELNFPGRRLWLELTETELLENNSVVLSNINALRAADVTVAIDDFGAGYSSLSYLDHFPSDVVKIDKSLVRDCNTRESSRIIMKAIRELAAANDFVVVAEGIESDIELTTVINADVDLLQGFALYGPLSEGALVTHLARDEAFSNEQAAAFG
ncbi:MAG: EAL domain-containing protein [Paracoccaceae bacterium]